MDIKEKQKIYILAAIFGLAGVMLYYSLLLKPQFSSFMVKNKEFGIVKARVKNAGTLIANEAGIIRQHEELKKQADYLEKRLPSQDKISNILEDFSNIAEASGVKILKIKPLEDPMPSSKQKAGNNSYKEFPILIEARAGYHQLGFFVNKLEAMDRFIRVMDVDIMGNNRDPRHHDIKIRIITYVLQ